MERIKKSEWQNCFYGGIDPCSQIAKLIGAELNMNATSQELEEEIIQTANEVRAGCQAHQLINSGNIRYKHPVRVRRLACVSLILKVTNRLGGFMEGPVYDAKYETRA